MRISEGVAFGYSHIACPPTRPNKKGGRPKRGSLVKGVEVLTKGCVNSGSSGYVSWEPSAYAVMPGMRVSSVTIPDWLENAAAGAGAIPMM